MRRYSGLDDDGNWIGDGSGDFVERLDDQLLEQWTDESDVCSNGCGQSKDRCICRLPDPNEYPRSFKTLTQSVREAEADVTPEDLQGTGMSWDQWQKIRQWPEDGES